MSPRNKILHHPDKEEIIEWLTQGVSVREVANRLEQRYPRKNQAHKRVSASTVQAFKAQHLNLKGKVLEDIKEHTRLAQQLVNLHSAQEEVASTSAYQQAIAKIAEQELNTNEQIVKVFYIVESRIEDLFERVSSGEFLNKDAERLLQGYLDQFMKAFEQHKKYIEGHKETTETNININIMNDQVSIMREAIRETLLEVEPELAIIFMDKLNSKMRDLVYSGTATENSANAAFLNKALGAKHDA
jgi:hypothetical protein